MGKLIDRIVTFFSKASAQADNVATGPDGSFAWPYPYDTLARLPELHPWHARCLEVIGQASVGIGYAVGADGDEPAELARKRAVLESLTADAFTSFCAFGQFTLDACGVAYLEVVRNKAGAIAELFWIPPQYMWVARDGGFVYRPDAGTTRRFADFGKRETGINEVVMLRIPFLRDRRYGLPRWVSSVRAIGLDNNAIDYNSNFFANSAIPDLVLIIEGGEFTPEVEEEVKNFLVREFKGVENSHRTLYIPVPDPNVKVRLEKLNMEVRDMAFARLRELNRDEIIAAHGVPPRILGVMAAGALGGGGEVGGQILVFDQVTLQPRRRYLEKVLNKTILADLALGEIAFDGIDATTGLEDAERLSKLIQAGIITVDEARGECGYDPLPAASPADSGDDDVAKMVAALHRVLQ